MMMLLFEWRRDIACGVEFSASTRYGFCYFVRALCLFAIHRIVFIVGGGGSMCGCGENPSTKIIAKMTTFSAATYYFFVAPDGRSLR